MFTVNHRLSTHLLDGHKRFAFLFGPVFLLTFSSFDPLIWTSQRTKKVSPRRVTRLYAHCIFRGKVLVFVMAANMFVFLAFFAFLIGSSATLKCTERPSIELLDCSGLHLSSLPHFWQPRAWVKFLDLKRNVIVDLNFSSLAARFPRLEEVDVRENPFDCGLLSSLLPTELIEVRSDCEPRRTALPPTTTTNLLYAKTATTDVPSFSQHGTDFTTHHVGNAEGRVLLISLLSSFCVLTFVVLDYLEKESLPPYGYRTNCDGQYAPLLVLV